MSAACIKARVSAEAVYRERNTKPDFAKAWDAAIQQGVESLESKVWDRAADGVPHGVWRNDANGNPVRVEVVREYSDSLAIVLLKAHAPHKYKDNMTLQNPDGTPLAVPLVVAIAEADIPKARPAAGKDKAKGEKE